MKLTESDSSLNEVCRTVEERLRDVGHLQGVNLPVTLLPNFNDLPLPVTPKDPTAYDGSKHTILVNARVFPALPQEVAQFALAHEIGHHTHETGITTSSPRFKGVHSCIVADWLAAQWGFGEGMRTERLEDRGEEFCDKLSAITSEAEFLTWVENWQSRFRIARLLGRPITSPSDNTSPS